MISLRRLIVLLLVGVASATSWAASRTATVNNLNDSGPGSLRHTIQTAESVDTIVFSVTGTIALTSGEIKIQKSFVIVGPGSGALTVSGSGLSRVFSLRGGERRSVGLSGLTIADGKDWSGGGGVLVDGPSSLSISNCVFTRNSAGGPITQNAGGGTMGGAILNSGGSVSVTDSIFTNNSALAGCFANFNGTLVVERCAISDNSCDLAGALWNDSGVAAFNSCLITGHRVISDCGGLLNRRGATLTVSSCIITNNHSAVGWIGGIGNQGILKLQNSLVAGNSSALQGGGIWNDSILTVDNCTIANNQCGGFGGGGLFNAGLLTANNSTISANSANSGGGITTLDIITVPGAVGPVTTTLNHCTVYSNTAQQGGGAANLGSVMGGSADHVQIVLNNTILAGNTATTGDGPDAHGRLTSADYNLIGNDKDTIITGSTARSLIGNIFSPIDPLLDALQDNGGSTPTHALLPGSPAIDAGNCGLLLIDQRGISRPQGAACDIGAFEKQ